MENGGIGKGRVEKWLENVDTEMPLIWNVSEHDSEQQTDGAR